MLLPSTLRTTADDGAEDVIDKGAEQLYLLWSVHIRFPPCLLIRMRIE